MPSDVEKSGTASIKELKQRRATLQGSITRIKNTIDTKGVTMSTSELETRLSLLETNFKNAMESHSEIERLSSDNLDEEEKKRYELEEMYCGIKASILSHIALHKKRDTTTTHPENSSQTSFCAPSKSSLPKLKLPHFTGKYTEWTNFFGTFTSLVHSDPDLSEVEKFQHLISCLGERPLQTIQDLEKTNKNYEVALSLLKDRYDNKCIIFMSHIKELFDLPRAYKGTAAQLRAIADLSNAHLRALKSLGNAENILNAILVHLAVSKLDSDTLSKWDDEVSLDSLPSWETLSTFISKRATNLENRSSNFEPARSSKFKPRSLHGKQFSTLVSGTSSGRCESCKGNCLSLQNCIKFVRMSPLQRFYEAKRLFLCLICLKKGHSIQACKMGKKCEVCQGRHNTLLHRSSTDTSPTSNNQSNTPNSLTVAKDQISSSEPTSSGNCPTQASSRSSSCLPASNTKEEQVLLATAVLLIKNNANKFVTCRALLDSGSQINCITERLAQNLGLRRENCKGVISGIGAATAKIRSKVWTFLRSRVNDFELNLECCVLSSITELHPARPINVHNWNIPKNLELADPNFDKPERIDLLIGAEVFFELLSIGQIKLHERLPTLQKTRLGWIVTGKHSTTPLSALCANVSNSSETHNDERLDKLLERFWFIENLESNCKVNTKEHDECEAHFLKYVRRTLSGRFIVRLPLRQDPSLLGNSFECAKKRFFNLERRLARDQDLKSQYVDFIREYQQLDHMEIVQESDIENINYFLPHHCVIRPESTSTKLRVVFDASCRTTSNLSLNDIMMVGPAIQSDLFDIMIRFRFYRYVITGDITKMYRQILVNSTDAALQLILWREQPADALQIFRLRTVTYGTSAASFLATRCLRFLADEFSSKYPLGSDKLKQDFYMDDLLTGAETIQETCQIRDEIEEILRSGQFHIRKWCSNDSQILAEIPERDKEKLIEFHDENVKKALGVVWEPNKDNLQFRITLKNVSSSITKRTILAETASIFDPLGLLTPVVVLAKVFLQELWVQRLDWDESLPVNLHTQWETFRAQLAFIQELRFPRFVLATPSAPQIELHGFADASQRAYGAVVYVRSVHSNGIIKVTLLCAKSRVAPVRSISLPRLELCGALLLADLITRLRSVLPIKIHKLYCWTDSTIVLDWLLSHASTWSPFVSNRVSKIQNLSPDITWNHVDGKANPADIVSRGMLPRELANSELWFVGPSFLQSNEGSWPTPKKVYHHAEELPERRKINCIILPVQREFGAFLLKIKYLNEFGKLRRTFAYILRFIRNTQASVRGKERRSGPFSIEELDNATKRMIWIVQNQEFDKEIHELENSKMISPKSSIRTLNPFLDGCSSFRLLRVGGRLQKADLTFDLKHPILLPKSHPLVLSLINYFHIKNLHAGLQALSAILRQQYWIINARSVIRMVVFRCYRCFRIKPRLINQIMGDLPACRVQPSRPFVISGVDFCGPFWITLRQRGKGLQKAYVAVFICFATKAVHLEVVSELSTQAFLASLKRFISRRGHCRTLYCDNGTNFVGARRELKELHQHFNSQQTCEILVKLCAEDGIEFRHIPPRSPHFGGLWEAAVKQAKILLNKTFGLSSFTFEELTTIMSQIEAILNSRPITDLSSDPSDYEALTPGHFLIGAPLTSIVEPSLEECKLSRLSRWQQLTALQQRFWKRWSKEYVLSLQQRQKWSTQSANISLGTLVLIADDGLPPLKWSLGRVIELHPDSKGIVRVVTLKTKNGTFVRSIHRLCPLPAIES